MFFTQLNIKWYLMNIFFSNQFKTGKICLFSLSHMKTNFCVDLLDKLVFAHKEKKTHEKECPLTQRIKKKHLMKIWEKNSHESLRFFYFFFSFGLKKIIFPFSNIKNNFCHCFFWCSKCWFTWYTVLYRLEIISPLRYILHMYGIWPPHIWYM